jgi:chromosome segregation ATPase
MATQNVCLFNKYGFCKFSDKCRKYHEKNVCENLECEIKTCVLRHPKVCKFFRDLGYCKFSEYCQFKHKMRKLPVQDSLVKEMNDKLGNIEKDLKDKSDKISKLESEIKDNNLKFFEHEKTIEKLNKKLNYLKEKEIILVELQQKYDDLEKKVEENSFKIIEKDKVPEDIPNKNEELSVCTTDIIKCEKCEFTANSESDLKIHIQDNHKRRKNIKCWKCDFTTKTKEDLTTHNDKYWYSHRMCIEERFKKYILEEFDQLKTNGFTVNESTKNLVSSWKSET